MNHTLTNYKIANHEVVLTLCNVCGSWIRKEQDGWAGYGPNDDCDPGDHDVFLEAKERIDSGQWSNFAWKVVSVDDGDYDQASRGFKVVALF